jgi:PKD repeat protein
MEMRMKGFVTFLFIVLSLGLLFAQMEPPVNLTAELDDATGEVELNWQHGVGGGFYEDFEDDVADNWVPVVGNWSVSGGYYNASSSNYEVSSSYYNDNFSNFEYEVKMRKTYGNSNSIGFNFNGDPSDINEIGYWNNGYGLHYFADGEWILFVFVSGTYTFIQDFAYSPDLNLGINSWNIIKVIYSDGYIDIYFNGILQGTYYDDSIISGYTGVILYDSDFLGQAEYDYATLQPLTAAYTFGEVDQTENQNIYSCNNESCPNNSNPGDIIGKNLTPQPTLGSQYTYYPNSETRDFQHFKVYRDGSAIGTTTDTFYSDNLSEYGTYEYEVTAYYDEGESDPAGPITVEWLDPIVMEGLLAYYPFAGNADDLSGNEHHGDVYGLPQLTTDRFGIPDRAYYFDGLDDYIACGNWFNYQDFSISVWVNQADLLYYYVDIIDNNHTDSVNWVVQYNQDLSSYHFGCGPQGCCFFSLPFDEWKHLVCVKDEGTLRTYLDGVLQDELITGISTINYSNPNLFIARWASGGRFFNGKIDDVRLYDRALSEDEIDLLFNESIPLSADFIADVVSGNAPLAVNFTDISTGNPTSWEWDFNNDGTIDSNEQNPIFTYSDTGVYTVALVVENGLYTDIETKVDYISVSSTNTENETIPLLTELVGNFPNPFNPSTTISYNLRENSIVQIEIFNMKGQKVKTLANQSQTPGAKSVIWNGVDQTGQSVSSGIYFYKLKTDNLSQTKKMILLK